MGISVFADQMEEVFTAYHAVIQFRDRVVGGIPKDPKMIEGWLRSKAGIDDKEELRHALLRTLEQLDVGVDAEMTYDQLVAASESVAQEKHGTGFKRDENGLYLEERLVKAMLRSTVNIAYPWKAGDKGLNSKTLGWTNYAKTAHKVFRETVFVNPSRLYLGREEPDGMDVFIGHIDGPNGRQSNLSYYEYCDQPTIEFDVIVMNDMIPAENWGRVWVLAQENGLGAKRSQSFGKFDVVSWERTS